jgi:hypothetical protein
MWVLAVLPSAVGSDAHMKFPGHLGLAQACFVSPLRSLALGPLPFIW